MTVLAPSSAASSLDTREGLFGAVASWLHRDDLTDILPNLLVLVEAAIRKDVRCRAMEASTSGTLTAASLTAPTLMVEVRRLIIDDVVQQYLTPQQWEAHADCTHDQYTLVGETLYLQSSTGDYQLDYFKAFDPLTDDTDSNWLLQYYPDVYLFGLLSEAAVWAQQDPTLYQAKFVSAIEKIRRVENANRFPGVMRVRVDGTVA
jgi:hypothetical protein